MAASTSPVLASASAFPGFVDNTDAASSAGSILTAIPTALTSTPVGGISTDTSSFLDYSSKINKSSTPAPSTQPLSTSSVPTHEAPATAGKSGLNGGLIGGIVAIIVIVFIIAFFTYIWLRRRRRDRGIIKLKQERWDKAELDNSKRERAELDTAQQVHELDGNGARAELPVDLTRPNQLPRAS